MLTTFVAVAPVTYVLFSNQLHRYEELNRRSPTDCFKTYIAPSFAVIRSRKKQLFAKLFYKESIATFMQLTNKSERISDSRKYRDRSVSIVRSLEISTSPSWAIVRPSPAQVRNHPACPLKGGFQPFIYFFNSSWFFPAHDWFFP